MDGWQSKWMSVRVKMGEWLAQLKSKIVDLQHCDDVSEVSEEDKAVSASATAYGSALVAAGFAVLFQLQPEKLLGQDSSKSTLTRFAHEGSAGACVNTIVFGLALLFYHTRCAGPSPKATKIKKSIAYKGILWFVIALFWRGFLALPNIAPVAGVVVIGIASTVMYGRIRSWVSSLQSPEKIQANSKSEKEGIPPVCDNLTV